VPPDFEQFDQRHYQTVPVESGYRDWAATYEDTVADIMDLALLDRLTTVDWRALTSVADLGCGSGRTAQWLRARSDCAIDGVDLTPAMLDLARVRAQHRTLTQADVRHTGLDPSAYDLVICSLVDEHLDELNELYLEAARLLAPDGPHAFVIVGFHPYFIMASGMPTHFDGPDGTPVAIETHIHLPSEHHRAATEAGFKAAEFHEAVVDDGFIERKPGWERYRGWPFSYAWTWIQG
jgi:SAM-dependent methyltransferase